MEFGMILLIIMVVLAAVGKFVGPLLGGLMTTGVTVALFAGKGLMVLVSGYLIYKMGLTGFLFLVIFLALAFYFGPIILGFIVGYFGLNFLKDKFSGNQPMDNSYYTEINNNEPEEIRSGVTQYEYNDEYNNDAYYNQTH